MYSFRNVTLCRHGHQKMPFIFTYMKKYTNDSNYYYHASQLNHNNRLNFLCDNFKSSPFHQNAFNEGKSDSNPLQFIIDSFDISSSDNDNIMETSEKLTNITSKQKIFNKDEIKNANNNFEKYLLKSKWKEAAIHFEKLLKYNYIPSKSKINTFLLGF